MKEKELFTCSICGCEVDREHLHEFDEEFLCEDCFNDETVVCDHCEDRIWRDDNCGDGNINLCSACMEDYYLHCSRCDRIIRCDDACYTDYDEDTPYCDDCYDEIDRECFLHEYSYKPEPIFYGNGKRFFGVELEIDNAGRSNDNAEILQNVANFSDELVYIKSDGSLDSGLEIVTHPMSLKFQKANMPWTDVCRKALQLGYRSHKTGTCGLHVHVNRASLGKDAEIQDQTISRILFFVERFWQELLKFSRRTEYQVQRWAARYGYKDKPKEILETAKKGNLGRYTCVNLTNFNTIEFRIFRGTLKVNTIIATLELVNELCEVAISMSDSEVSALSWCDFVERIDTDKYPELIRYLKERRMYINEPVTDNEEE